MMSSIAIGLWWAAMAAGMAGPSGTVAQDTTVIERWRQGPVSVAVRRQAPRRIEWEVYVPAPVDSVWAAWTKVEEMVKWAAPGAEVDLRPGGTWEAHFFPDRPPGQRGGDANRILRVIPDRELWIEAGAPAEFPTVRREKTLFIVRVEAAGSGHTRVQATQLGWKEGPEWDRAFEAITSANAQWLGWLHRRFTDGPIDWSALMPESGALR